MLHIVIAHPVREISEIASYKRESVVVEDVLFCIFILVESLQMTVLAQTPQDFLAVASATEGYVYINTVGLDVKPVDALLKEYWSMICLSSRYHRASPAFILFSNSIPNSSSVFSVCVRFFGDQISTVSSMPINWMS